MASRFAMHHVSFTFTIVVTLCIISQALAAAEPPIGEATALYGNSTAHSATAQVHHKSLTPLAGTDIGLCIVVAVALFIASGAGVGGGKTELCGIHAVPCSVHAVCSFTAEDADSCILLSHIIKTAADCKHADVAYTCKPLQSMDNQQVRLPCSLLTGVLVVPSLLIISQFSAIAAVALSNVTILASSVANLGFNLPRKSVLCPGPLIDWDLVLLFGPPTVIGSIAGSYVNMVIPSW